MVHLHVPAVMGSLLWLTTIFKIYIYIYIVSQAKWSLNVSKFIAIAFGIIRCIINVKKTPVPAPVPPCRPVAIWSNLVKMHTIHHQLVRAHSVPIKRKKYHKAFSFGNRKDKCGIKKS